MWKIINGGTIKVLFCGDKKNNVYIINTCDLDNSKIEYHSTVEDQTQLWHRRVGHLNVNFINL